jgi:SCY1-like protein 1
MLASLKAFVSSGPTFPYTIGQPFATAWGGWTHYRGTAKDDNSAVSIFKISAPNANDPKLRAARNGVKRLKLVGAVCLTHLYLGSTKCGA